MVLLLRVYQVNAWNGAAVGFVCVCVCVCVCVSEVFHTNTGIFLMKKMNSHFCCE